MFLSLCNQVTPPSHTRSQKDFFFKIIRENKKKKKVTHLYLPLPFPLNCSWGLAKTMYGLPCKTSEAGVFVLIEQLVTRNRMLSVLGLPFCSYFYFYFINYMVIYNSIFRFFLHPFLYFFFLFG